MTRRPPAAGVLPGPDGSTHIHYSPGRINADNPPLSAADVARALRFAASLAYLGDALGVRIGAVPFNLGYLGALGASIALTSGAGTFDGLFLTGVIATLVASPLVN